MLPSAPELRGFRTWHRNCVDLREMIASLSGSIGTRIISRYLRTAMPAEEIKGHYTEMFRYAAILLGLTMLTACAGGARPSEQAQAPDRLPTSAEVEEYVGKAWDSIYARRFAAFASRPNETPALISVSTASCGYEIVTPECSFDVVARFPSEEPQHRQLIDTFGWEKGELESVMVFYEERRAPARHSTARK